MQLMNHAQHESMYPLIYCLTCWRNASLNWDKDKAFASLDDDRFDRYMISRLNLLTGWLGQKGSAPWIVKGQIPIHDKMVAGETIWADAIWGRVRDQKGQWWVSMTVALEDANARGIGFELKTSYGMEQMLQGRKIFEYPPYTHSVTHTISLKDLDAFGLPTIKVQVEVQPEHTLADFLEVLL